MAREICKLTMTVIDHGDTTEATGSVEVNCTGEGMVHILAHLFEILHLSPKDALALSLVATATMTDDEEEDT